MLLTGRVRGGTLDLRNSIPEPWPCSPKSQFPKSQAEIQDSALLFSEQSYFSLCWFKQKHNLCGKAGQLSRNLFRVVKLPCKDWSLGKDYKLLIALARYNVRFKARTASVWNSTSEMAWGMLGSFVFRMLFLVRLRMSRRDSGPPLCGTQNILCLSLSP